MNVALSRMLRSLDSVAKFIEWAGSGSLKSKRSNSCHAPELVICAFVQIPHNYGVKLENPQSCCFVTSICQDLSEKLCVMRFFLSK